MKLQVRSALVLSVFALVVAVSGIAGAVAGQVVIGSKQIRNGSILSQDLKNNGVKSVDLTNGSVASADIANGEVSSADLGDNSVTSTEIANGSIATADIGANQVQGADLALPEPEQILDDTASAEVGPEFTLLDDVGVYSKVDPTSALEVTWTGSAKAGFSPCQFQLRVNGQPAGPGAGVIYVGNSTVDGSVSVSALFDGLPVGPADVQVWARATQPAPFPCTVGPAEAGMPQTFVIGEQVF